MDNKYFRSCLTLSWSFVAVGSISCRGIQAGTLSGAPPCSRSPFNWDCVPAGAATLLLHSHCPGLPSPPSSLLWWWLPGLTPPRSPYPRCLQVGSTPALPWAPLVFQFYPVQSFWGLTAISQGRLFFFWKFYCCQGNLVHKQWPQEPWKD